MSCVEYKRNISLMALAENMSDAGRAAGNSRVILYNVFLPLILTFGILGNILNLLILTRKQLKRTMDRMEKSVHVGLVALAASDLLFCLVMFPKSVAGAEVLSVTEDDVTPLLYYQVYYEPFLNTFMLSSTWLTVTMAMGRYLAICHPLHARWMVDIRATKVIIGMVFFLAILFNLPGFWRYYIIKTKCAEQCYCYALDITALYHNQTFVYAYWMAWAIIGVIIPVIILAFCNVCLIRALQQSNRMRRLYRANHTQHDDSGHRLTPTLIAIVAMFMLLVTPSDILKFISQHVPPWQFSPHGYNAFIIIQDVFNIMNVINFSVNFVLYCAINVHFRNTIKQTLCCRKEKSEVFKFTNITTVVNMSENEAEPL